MKATVLIEWNGKKEEVILQTITFGEKNNAARQSIKLVKRGNSLQRETDNIRYEVLQLLASIKKAPFPITEDGLNSLPSPVGDQLYAVFNKLHRVDQPEIVDNEIVGSSTTEEAS